MPLTVTASPRLHRPTAARQTAAADQCGPKVATDEHGPKLATDEHGTKLATDEHGTTRIFFRPCYSVVLRFVFFRGPSFRVLPWL